MKLATKIATVLLGIVALVHLVRLLLGWDVVIAGFTVPVWWSAFGFLIPGALAFFIYREHQG